MNPKLSFFKEDILIFDDILSNYETQKIIHTINHTNYFINSNGIKTGLIQKLHLANLLLSLLSPYLLQEGNLYHSWLPVDINYNFTWNILPEGLNIPYTKNEIINFGDRYKNYYSVVLYLNDDLEGDIIFPKYHLSFKPKTSRLIMFRNDLEFYSKVVDNQLYFLHTHILYSQKN